VGGADFCFDSATTSGGLTLDARGCADAEKMEELKEAGLTGAGCKTIEVDNPPSKTTVCLCEGDLCNA